ncbi:Carbonic anhydrase [hydrothermal vent metagenome]|uniref:carbonic anhydrase n=1 Tax=hydrothermal vent metagenome TaxID=652676 RepID=A0A1W1BXK6_9ZZZZ
MEKVHLDGYNKFKAEFFGNNKELFDKLAKGQNPHTMVITCSDSRVQPATILSTNPGDIFVAENIGNAVPPYDTMVGDSTQAALEYAVVALKIQHIIILAHSSCGACAHLYHEPVEGEPHLKHVDKWLELLQPAKDASLLEMYADKNKNISEVTEKNNLKLSLNRLMTYPYIREAMDNGQMKIHGWWYNVGTAKVEVYDQATKTFRKK